MAHHRVVDRRVPAETFRIDVCSRVHLCAMRQQQINISSSSKSIASAAALFHQSASSAFRTVIVLHNPVRADKSPGN